MFLNPHHISLSTKTCSPIRRESPADYVVTIRIDILHGEERENIWQALVYHSKIDRISNDNTRFL